MLLADWLRLHIITSSAQQLDDAQKFRFNDACCQAAASFAQEVRKAGILRFPQELLPYMRLPYELCWFEWMSRWFDWEPGKFGAPEDFEFNREYPHWSGALIRELNPSTWSIILFMTVGDHGTYEETLEIRIQLHVSPDFVVTSEFDENHLNKSRLKDDILAQAQPFCFMISAELIALVLLLNCKNVNTQSELLSTPKQVLKRLRRCKLPLYSHHTVILPLSKSQERAIEAGLCTREEARAHLVRGHPKHRKTGVFWWSSFVRGNSHQGLITKDYVGV